MEKPVPIQELLVPNMGLTGTIIGGGVLVQMKDGVTGLARAGHIMGSGEVLGMGMVLEAGRGLGLEVVALKVAGMVLEVGPVILLVVA